MKLKVKEINWGIASRVKDVIYLNERLNRYPKLKRALISHERAHSEGLAWRDVAQDLEIKELKGLKMEYYKFVATNPTTWAEFIPIKKYGKEWLINPTVMGIWLFLIMLIWMFVIFL